jgi:hypothetical protein
MRLILKTTKKTFFVKLPNYFDVSQVPEILEKATAKLPKGHTLTEHILHSDALTIDEHQQMRRHGRIISPMTELLVFDPFGPSPFKI